MEPKCGQCGLDYHGDTALERESDDEAERLTPREKRTALMRHMMEFTAGGTAVEELIRAYQNQYGYSFDEATRAIRATIRYAKTGGV